VQRQSRARHATLLSLLLIGETFLGVARPRAFSPNNDSGRVWRGHLLLTLYITNHYSAAITTALLLYHYCISSCRHSFALLSTTLRGAHGPVVSSIQRAFSFGRLFFGFSHIPPTFAFAGRG